MICTCDSFETWHLCPVWLQIFLLWREHPEVNPSGAQLSCWCVSTLRRQLGTQRPFVCSWKETLKAEIPLNPSVPGTWRHAVAPPGGPLKRQQDTISSFSVSPWWEIPTGQIPEHREGAHAPELGPRLLQAALVIGDMVLLDVGGEWVDTFISLALFAAFQCQSLHL